jgi:hypothetical protein
MVLWGGFLLATPLQERARRAEKMLGNCKWQEAVAAYSAILEEVSDGDRESLEFAYWIHRERAFAAFFLENREMTFFDITAMRAILKDYGCEEEVIREYYDILSLAQKAKNFCKEFESKRGDPALCYDRFRCARDESYFRTVNNQAAVAKMGAEKRAKELYYPGLVYDQEEMESVVRSIDMQDFELGERLKNFLREYGRGVKVLKADPVGWRACLAYFYVAGGEGTKVLEFIKKEGNGLWEEAESMQVSSLLVREMEQMNWDASYLRCIQKGIYPQVVNCQNYALKSDINKSF